MSRADWYEAGDWWGDETPEEETPMVETEVYKDDDTVIIHADVTEVALEVPVAAVVTSPPYNVGLDYGAEVSDSMDWDAYETMASESAAFMYDSLVSTGRVFLNVAPAVPISPGDKAIKHRVNLLGLWLECLEASDLRIWDIVAWTTPGRGGSTAWGSWQSPASPNLRGEWEAVIVAYKDEWNRPVPSHLQGWKDQVGDWPSLTKNVWTIPPKARDDHPAPFPEELACRAIRLATWPGETVLDPFCGTGTTLTAARSLGRRSVGIDKSRQWCDVAAARLAQTRIAL